MRKKGEREKEAKREEREVVSTDTDKETTDKERVATRSARPLHPPPPQLPYLLYIKYN